MKRITQLIAWRDTNDVELETVGKRILELMKEVKA